MPMKTSMIVFLMLFFTVYGRAAQEPNPAEYGLEISVDVSKITIQCGGVILGGSSCGWYQELTVHIDRVPYELLGLREESRPYLLKRGTYKGKIVSEQTPDNYEYARKYRLLLPDGKTADFQLVQE